jgi:hypothetical protein
MLADHQLNLWQAAQQHLRPTLLLRQHTGKVPAGEPGQPGLHLPRRPANDRQVPQEDPGLPAEDIDELDEAVRRCSMHLGRCSGDQSPVAGQLHLTPLAIQVRQHRFVGAGRVAADPDQGVVDDLDRSAAALPQHPRDDF